MISGAQFARHNSEWKAVCAAQGWDPADDDVRVEFYQSANLPASRKAWDKRRSFDTFLHACAVATGRGDAAHSMDAMARRRLVWRIQFDARRVGLDDKYLAKLSRDITGLSCWDELDLHQLTIIRDTIHNRARTKAADPRPAKPVKPHFTPTATRKKHPRQHSHAVADENPF